MSDREYVCSRLARVPDLGVGAGAASFTAQPTAPTASLDISALIKQGWSYQDFPRVRPAIWDLILEGLGEGNFHLLSLAQYGKPVEWTRGQMIIAPTGREALGIFYKAHRARFEAAIAAAGDDTGSGPSTERPEGTNNHPPESMK